MVFYASSTSTSSGALRRLLTWRASEHTRRVLGHLEEGVLFRELCRSQGRRSDSFTVLQVTAGPKRLAAQEVVFQPTGLRDLEGAPSLTEAHRAVKTWKHER